jgi:hypothetical protein
MNWLFLSIYFKLFRFFQHKILIDSINLDLVHHLLMYECDSTANFNDSNLPDELCDNIHLQVDLCLTNIATGWAVGGDDVRLRDITFRKQIVFE